MLETGWSSYGLVLALVVGCGGDDDGRASASGASGVATMGGSVFDVGSLDGTTGPGEDCVPPDVLVVLDRCQSMHRNPAGDTPPNDRAGYESSRWWIAVEALEGGQGASGQERRTMRPWAEAHRGSVALAVGCRAPPSTTGG